MRLIHLMDGQQYVRECDPGGDGSEYWVTGGFTAEVPQSKEMETPLHFSEVLSPVPSILFCSFISYSTLFSRIAL